MSIRITRSRDDLNVMTVSELIRKLDVPVSRMKKAIREGAVRPVGSIAHAGVVALTDDDIESLRASLHPMPADTQTTP